MTQTVIYTRAPRAAVKRALYSIPQRALAGGVVVDSMMAKCGVALLGHIRTAFIVKSQGGTDEAGENWKPLSPRTIAKRLAKLNRTMSVRDAHPSQALTSQQRERWWVVYRQQLARFRGNKSSAAKVAWTTLRLEGAHTLLDKYGTQKVDILRDTGELIDSLTPNFGSSKSVFRVAPGQVEVGTTRIGALSHHKGDPSRNLPQRRLWPAVEKWPSGWRRGILGEIQLGVVELTVQIVREVQT